MGGSGSGSGSGSSGSSSGDAGVKKTTTGTGTGTRTGTGTGTWGTTGGTTKEGGESSTAADLSESDVFSSVSVSVQSRSEVDRGPGGRGRRGGTRARKTSMSGSQSDGSDSGENSGDWSDSASVASRSDGPGGFRGEHRGRRDSFDASSGYDDQDESSSDIGDSSSVSVQSRSDHPTSAVKPSRTSNNRQTSVESTTGEENVEQDVDSSSVSINSVSAMW